MVRASEPLALEILPATVERFDDVSAMLAPKKPDTPACWCLYYRLGSAEFNAVEDRARCMKDFCAQETAPGMLAYADGKVVGWCAIGPRSGMGRLTRSKTIPEVDDLPVWSVVCFIVKAGYRRKGVAGALLGGAIEYARKSGAVALEAYPVNNEGAKLSGSFAYVGTVGMFEKAGFRKVADTSSRRGGMLRWVMRLDLRA